MSDAGDGRHATGRGDGLGRVVGWTVLGTVLPGTGLIAAGRRRLGTTVLAFFVLALVAGALVLVVGDPLHQGLSIALDPKKLLVLAVAAGVVGVLWAGLVVLTGRALMRQSRLAGGQRLLGRLLVLVLVAGVALPAFRTGEYALIARDVVTSKSVFRSGSSAGTGGPDTAKADPWADKARENVLLIGSDAGADRTGIRPDTLILASIDTHTGATVLISLPRSLQRARFAPGTPGAEAWPAPNGYYCPEIAPGDTCLLNAIWTWASGADGAKYYGKYGDDAGLRATEDAVEGVTGLKVDTYAMLNLKGFEDFVDAIGGVTVDVHQRLPIGGNGNIHSPLYHVATGGWIEVGDDQKLDGYHALWFARSRWAYDDYNRMQRQRCVIGAVVAQTDPVSVAVNFPAIAKSLKQNLEIGFSSDDLPAWVTLSERIKTGGVKSLVFEKGVINTVHPDYDAIHALVEKAITPAPAATASPSASATATPTRTPSATATSTAPTGEAQDVSKVC